MCNDIFHELACSIEPNARDLLKAHRRIRDAIQGIHLDDDVFVRVFDHIWKDV